jgi:hypothetical protein
MELRRNSSCRDHLGSEGALGNNVLEKLSLKQTQCGPALIGFGGVLSGKNTSLKYLDLSFCKLDNDDVVALCKGLEHNTTVEPLDLCGNQIEDKGETAVASLMQQML